MTDDQSDHHDLVEDIVHPDLDQTRMFSQQIATIIHMKICNDRALYKKLRARAVPASSES